MFKHKKWFGTSAFVLIVVALAACAAPAAPTVAPAPTPAPAPTVAPVPATAAPASPTVAPAPTTAPAAGPIVITDALGRAVKFDKLPQRIVLTGRAFFMIIDALYLFPEATARVVGLPDTTQSKNDFFAALDPNYASKFIIRGSNEAGPEQIAPVNPDVVITKSVNASRLGKSLEQVNIPVVYVDFETPEQYSRDLAILGQLLGNPERAKMIDAYFKTQVERVNAKIKNLKDADKPRVLLLQYSEKSGTVAFSIPPVEWMQTLIVEMAGGRSIWRENAGKGGWSVVNLEQIAAWNPDQVYIVFYGGDPKDAIAKIKADPKWQALKAVKENKVFGFPGDFYTWDQPDTRWGLGLIWLAAKTHPALFGDVNINQEIARFYALYGFDQAAIRSKVTPLLVGDLK